MIATIFSCRLRVCRTILAASIRHPKHMLDCALAGADVATVPFKVIAQFMKHPLTDKGLDAFLADYQKAFSR